ncbi:MAG: DJ-1/PfpI family protein [bacterium]
MPATLWTASNRHRASAVVLGLLLALTAGQAQITPANAARTIDPGEVSHPERRVAVFVPPMLFDEEVFQFVHRTLVHARWRPVIVGADTGIASGYANTVVRPELDRSGLVPDDFAALVLVGGSGAVLHWQDSTLHAAVRGFVAAGKPVAANGLAVTILARAGVLEGRRAAFYRESGAPELITAHDARFVFTPVVTDGNIVTAAGPDTERRFAAALVAALGPRK